MDAARTNAKKLSFLFAIGLWSIGSAQAAAPTLTVNSTAVTIGSSVCTDHQFVYPVSSDGSNIQYTVQVQYSGSTPNTGDQYGNWLYVRDDITGSSTSNGATFTEQTGTAGNTLRIGLNISIGAVSPTATVVLTPTTGSPVIITVYYTQNTSCVSNPGSAGNTVLNLTPGTLAFTTSAGGQQSLPLAIQNLTGNSLTYTVSTQGGAWLTTSYNSNTLAPNGTSTVTVTADASKITGASANGIVLIQAVLGQNPYGSILTIPVSLALGTGGGGGGGTSSGTLTLNGATSNSFTTSFTEIAQNPPGSQLVPIQDTTAGAASYSYTVTTFSGGSWLLANFNTSGNIVGLLAPSAGANVNLSLSNVANSLPTGAYQGTVALTSSSGSTATINVSLYVSGGTAPGISVTPGTVYQFSNVATGATNLQAQQFTVTALNGYNMGTASLTSSAPNSVFSMTAPNSVGSTQSFTITASPTGLIAGLYSATITIASSGISAGTTTILVVLPVGQGTNTGGGGGGNTATLLAPTQIAFQQQTGDSFWTGAQEGQTITLTGQAGATWTASIIYGAGGTGWLTFDGNSSGSGTFTSVPSTLTVDLFNGVGSLPPSPNPYTATVNITTPSGTSSVGVTVLVTPSNTPVLLGPASLTFSSNGAAPPSQVTQVVGSDNTSSPTNPFISLGTPTASWITATSNGNTLNVSVNPSGLGSGAYWGTIPVSASAYANALNYPVVLIVSGGSTSTGPLTLSSSALPFSNVTAAISQTLNVSAANTIAVTAGTSESSCSSSTWLSISPSGALSVGTANTPISVTVSPVGIANGTTCTGYVTLVTATATQSVSVSMTVGTSSGSGGVTVSPQTLSFTYTQQQSAPQPQTVTIINASSGTGIIPFTVSTSVQGSVGNWLQTSVASASTPYNNPGLSVSVVPGSLNPGTYQGSVTITPTGGTAQVIGVTLVVTANAVVSATPTTLSLSYIVGGTSPTGTIQVSGGGAVAGFTAVTSSSSGWLKVSAASGNTPNTGTFNLTVSLDPTALAALLPGTYNGTVTVAGVSPATGTTIVNVTLNVTAPLPTITAVTNAASGASGSISPGEFISIFANANLSNPIGPTPPVLLSATTCPSPCTQVPTTMGGVQVVFLPLGIAAPLTYVSGAQINALVPYEVAQTGLTNVSVQVRYLGQTSNAFPLTTTTLAPGIFTATGTGSGQAAIAQYDTGGNYKGNNSATNPAQKGWILSIYMTGEGVLNPAAKTGSVTAIAELPLAVPSVLIDGQPTSLAGYAEAGGIVSGVLQVNAIVPQAARTGNVSLQVSLGTASSQTGVTVFLQ